RCRASGHSREYRLQAEGIVGRHPSQSAYDRHAPLIRRTGATAMGGLLERASGGGRFLAFLLSNLVQRAGQLFLLAGLTFLGTADDVYRFGLFISLFNLIVPILSLNIHMAIGRISFSIADDQERHNFILSCLISGLAAVASGIVLLAIIFQA